MPFGKGQLKLRRRSFGSAFFACHEVLSGTVRQYPQEDRGRKGETPYCPYERPALGQGRIYFLGWSLWQLEGGPHLT